MHMIEVENIAKQFGAVCAVRDVSFRAADGAITGLLGANGAGKSTTLRMIAGVLQPARGRITIDGVVPFQAGVGALLDHAGLYGRLTARENLIYFGQLRGIPPAALARRVDELLDLLDFRRLADRRTAGFSQGERMKTALGRALIHSPRNILLDEPANGLDVPSVRGLRALLGRLRDAGACILFSSHVLPEVRALCDRVVVIARGSVVAEGSPEELCRRTGSASLEDAFIRLTGESEESCSAAF
jgi:sodium transport system ATP-binding protein